MEGLNRKPSVMRKKLREQMDAMQPSIPNSQVTVAVADTLDNTIIE